MSDETPTSEAPADSTVTSTAVETTSEPSPFLPSDPVSPEAVDDSWIYKSSDEPDESAAADDTETSEATPDAGQAKPGIDEALVAIAVHAGFTREDAMAFPSTKALHTALTKMADIAARSAPGSQAQIAAPYVEQQAYYVPQPEPFKVALDPEQYAPEVVKAFEDMNAHYTGQLSQMQEQLQALSYHTQAEQLKQQQAEIERHDADLNSWFDSLTDYQDLVGKGEMRSLKPGSREHSTRLEVVDVYYALRDSYQASGRVPPPDSTLKQRALSAVLGPEIEKRATRKENERIQQVTRNRMGQFAARPTPKKVDQIVNPEDRAIVAVAEKMAEYGLG